MSVKMKPWRMRPDTRNIVSKAYKLCKEMNETYGQRVTVRQIYYHLFSNGLIQLTQRDYQKVVRIITKARLKGYIPFEWIEDRSRTPLWKMLYDDIPDFLNKIKNRYAKNTWANQENFVIILIEKEALAQIVWDIAEEYNVFVFPTKGFSSWSMFVEDIKELYEYFGAGKRLVVLVLSDLDPSGECIKEDYEFKFMFMTDELGFPEPLIEKIAVTEEQIKKYNIPMIEKHYRNKGIVKICELDALDPKVLRQTVKEAIEKYVDVEQVKMDLEIETDEIKMLESLIELSKKMQN